MESQTISIPNECQPMLGLEELGLGWGLGSWNGLDRNQFGEDKIGWELEWISTKEEVGIGIQWMFRMIKRIGKVGVRAIGKIEHWIDDLGTTVFEENKQNIEV